MIARLKAAWRALMGTTALVQHEPDPDPLDNQPKGMRISDATLWEARTHRRPLPAPEEVFANARPMPGVLPAGMAMDSACPPNSAGTWGAASIMETMMHEGLTFLGYPYLAQLTQRAEYRHATEIWAEHATRNWIELKGDDAKIKALADELERLGARDAIESTLNLDGHFGRGQIFLDFGDADNPREISRPLKIDKRKINQSRPLRAIKVVEPMWSYPAAYETSNPLAQGFYTPKAWYVYGKTVHASRLLTLIGRPVPDMLKPAYAFGGLSLTQMMKPYVDNWLRTRQSVSDMAHSYSTMVLLTDMDAVLQGGDAGGLFDRVDTYVDMRDNQGVFVADKAREDVKNVAAPISGLDKLQAQAQEQLSSVSRIPLSIYLQITPTGLNASSEGELRSFKEDVKSLQEKKIDPILRTIVNVVQLSLWGEIDEKITYEYVPLWEMSDKEKAEVRKIDAETDQLYEAAGAVSNEEIRDRLRNDESSLYHGGLKGAAPEPEDDEDDKPAAANDEGVGELAAVPFGDSYSPDQPRNEYGKWTAAGAVTLHVSRAMQSPKEKSTTSLGLVSETNASAVLKHTGVNIAGFEREIRSDDIRHVMNSHGDPVREQARGQIAIRKADFERIPAIVENAHTITKEGTAQSAKGLRLEYTAELDGHEYGYVETVSGGKVVALKSMRKK